MNNLLIIVGVLVAAYCTNEGKKFINKNMRYIVVSLIIYGVYSYQNKEPFTVDVDGGFLTIDDHLTKEAAKHQCEARSKDFKDKCNAKVDNMEVENKVEGEKCQNDSECIHGFKCTEPSYFEEHVQDKTDKTCQKPSIWY